MCGVIALLGMLACSDDIEPSGTESNTGHSIVYKLNVSANNGNERTRALTLDEKNHIHTAWKAGDKMFVYNCSDNNQSTEKLYSTVATQNDGGFTASFTGEIKSKNAMQETDVLSFFYPGAAIKQQDNVVAGEYTQEKIKNQSGADVVVEYYKNSAAIKDQVLLNLSEQDGTLETIDKKYDYCWGKTSPTDISGDATNGYTCNAKVDLHRMVAFWGLKFNGGKEGTPLTNIKQISINGLKSTDVLSLKDGKLIGTDQNKNFSINISNNGEIIKLTNGYIWVALLPGETHKVTITLKTTDGKLYSKTVNKTFKENTTYRSSITNMNEVIAEPYVTVCGTKWATGNFIRYVDPDNSSNVYWGIAPAQWWISHYGENPTTANYLPAAGGNTTPIRYKDLGSQHWCIDKIIGEDGFGAWGITEKDLDLFTWGAIKDVLNFNLIGNYLRNAGLGNIRVPKDERGNLTKKWWERTDRPVVSVTTDPTKANYGDIVWYYTYDATHNHHYRYPTQEELKALRDANTIVPAYCYTDKGNKVYGAYFSDAGALPNPSGTKNIQGFPTGLNSTWKYENVTGLVLANKGLFLPITGRRAARETKVQYRYLDNGSTFFSAYSSSRETAVSTMTALFFGSNEWVYGAPQKQQGLPIRPVYDSGDETAPVDASKFAPFNKIITSLGARKY